MVQQRAVAFLRVAQFLHQIRQALHVVLVNVRIDFDIARIFGVVDTVDAMTSDRPYRSALPFEEARHVVEQGAGIQFDPQVAAIFLAIPTETWQAIREQASVDQMSAALTGIFRENLCNSTECVGVLAD